MSHRTTQEIPVFRPDDPGPPAERDIRVMKALLIVLVLFMLFVMLGVLFIAGCAVLMVSDLSGLRCAIQGVC